MIKIKPVIIRNAWKYTKTASGWMKYKQCCEITEKLAENLFGMEDMSYLIA